jgi:F-type H+-transporting ATPase subunit b
MSVSPLAVLGWWLAAMGVAAAEEGGAHGGGSFDLVARVVNFAVLVGVIVYLLRKPLAQYLEAKSEQIRQELAEAARKREQARADRDAASARLTGIERDVAELRARAVEEAEAERARILSAAELEASRIRELARKEIATELEVARRRLKAEATELAVDLARRKLEQAVNERDRDLLFERSLEALKESR